MEPMVIGGAAVAAATLAVLQHDATVEQRWLRVWAPWAARGATVVVVAVHGLVGALAALVAQGLGWSPFDPDPWWWANALVFATGGQALFRADWSGYFLEPAGAATSLQRAMLRAVHARVEGRAERNVRRWLARLPDERLHGIALAATRDRIPLGNPTAAPLALQALESQIADASARLLQADTSLAWTPARTELVHIAFHAIRDARWRALDHPHVGRALQQLPTEERSFSPRSAAERPQEP